MLKKLMILPIAAGFLAVNANAACDQIGSKDELDAFAAKVNGGEVSACAELTADIYYNETQVVNDALTGLANGVPENVWTPIGKDDNHPFRGSIDGQGHTIYGLYMNNGQDWDASLVSVALDGTVVKNLRVEDSFFKSSSGGNGGVIGKASAGAVLVENCSFKGHVEGGSNNGGIVGSIQNSGNLTLRNCYNEGNISGKTEIGGLVGIAMKSGSNKLTLDNCYNVGMVSSSDKNKSNPLVGNLQTGSSATAENVGCLSSASNCTSVVKSGVTQGDSATLALSYLNNKSGASDVLTEWNKKGIDSKVETLESELEEEIAVEKVQIQQNWFTKVTVSKTSVSEAAPFVVKQDVVTDIITFDREYQANVASTIILPFNCNVANMTAKAKFYEFTDVKQVDGAWKVFAKQVSVLNANEPYMIMPQVTGLLTFDREYGPYILRANNNGGAYEKSIGNTAWKAVGVYTKKRWDTGVNENEIGTIYGFAAEAKSEKNPGDFVRGGKKVAVLPMRSYLKYAASTDEESVVSTPTLTKMRAISSAEIASIEALPQRIEVELEDAPERVESIDVPGVSEEVGIQEGQDDVLGITKNPVIRLDNQKADRWFNVNGRNMNAKPKSQGAFIKNSTPVIVK